MIFTKHNDSRQSRKFSGLMMICGGWLPNAVRLFLALGLLLAAHTAHAQTTFTEYQVKALFLFKFAKYVEWPAETFPATNSPIIIGVLGKDNFKDDLNKAVDGKKINGRAMVIKPVVTDADIAGCHILFISASENSRLDDLLKKTRALPLLTVGEDKTFLGKGGIINFIIKEEKVRLEINLDAARPAKVQISSKLLSVADVVKGKPK